MSASFDYTKVDLYDILEVQIDATEKDVIKAYRKKALKYHPDKNSDPAAVEIFHQLSKALEILTDSAAKAAYDKILKARAAAQIRHKQLDAKRQKLKEDLEAREHAGLSEEQQRAQQAKNLHAEIERLRKEGSSLLQREQALLREELAKQAKEKEVNSTLADTDEPIRIKLKWKCSKSDSTNGGYNQSVITSIFEKYGEVAAVLLSSKKKGTAVLEFDSSSSQLQSVDTESGLSSCPLAVSWLSGKPPPYTPNEHSTNGTHNQGLYTPTNDLQPQATADSTTQQGPSHNSLTSDADFEELVLTRMRQAEERRQLTQQLMKEDEEEEKLNKTDT